MSEVETAAPAAPVAAPVVEAPVVAPTPVEAAPAATPQAAPEAPEAEQRQGPRTRSERRREAFVRAAAQQAAREQARVVAGTPEGGQFAKAEKAAQEAGATPAAVDVATTPSEPKAAVVDTPAITPAVAGAVAPAPTPQTTKIQLSATHPLRARGITEWDAPPGRESETRGMLNAMEAQAASQARQRDLTTQNAVLEARLRAQSGELPFKPNPEVEHLMGEIEAKYSPEIAAMMREGLNALNAQHMQRVEQQALAGVQEQRIAESFVGKVAESAPQRFPVWAQSGELNSKMHNLLTQYGTHVDARNAAQQVAGRPNIQPTDAEFWQWVGPLYAQDPRVQQNFKSKDEQSRKALTEKAKAEARAEFATQEAAKLSEAAARHNTRPPSTSSHSSSGRTNEVSQENLAATGANRRKALRQGVSQRYSQ